VLGQGDVSVALRSPTHAFSTTAAEKLTRAGGSVEVV
jgi:ribosomal protein L15